MAINIALTLLTHKQFIRCNYVIFIINDGFNISNRSTVFRIWEHVLQSRYHLYAFHRRINVMIESKYTNAYNFISVFILHNECHPPPAILLDDAVEHVGKVDLRWQQLEVVGKPDTVTQLIRWQSTGDLYKPSIHLIATMSQLSYLGYFEITGNVCCGLDSCGTFWSDQGYQIMRRVKDHFK